MSTDHEIHEPHEPTLDTHRTAADGTSQPRDEATMRADEGLSPDTMILIPAFAPPPMRCPDGVWALLVTVVDIVGDDPDSAVALFAGIWVYEQPTPDSTYEGDLVLRLSHPADHTNPLSRPHTADVEMLLAYKGRWRQVGRWSEIDDSWPSVVAPAAATLMALHSDAAMATA
jgi:hypothetical protein